MNPFEILTWKEFAAGIKLSLHHKRKTTSWIALKMDIEEQIGREPDDAEMERFFKLLLEAAEGFPPDDMVGSHGPRLLIVIKSGIFDKIPLTAHEKQMLGKLATKKSLTEVMESGWWAMFADLEKFCGRSLTSGEKENFQKFVRQEWAKVLDSENAYARLEEIQDAGRNLIHTHASYPDPL